MSLKNIVWIALIICITVGYLSDYWSVEANNLNTTYNPDGLPETPETCDGSLHFDSVERGKKYHYETADEPNLVIMNNWDEIIELRNFSPAFDETPFQLVDYSEYMLIAALSGWKPSTNFKVEIKQICKDANTISIVAENFNGWDGGNAIVYPYHIVRLSKEDHWGEHLDFVFLLDGQQVFTQTHFISGSRGWETLDQNEAQSGWVESNPNLKIIGIEGDVSSVASLISAETVAALQKLDYEQSYALLVLQGQQPSTGYGIEIQQIGREGNRMIIHTHAIEPRAGAEVRSGTTSPYHLIQVDRYYENGDELDFILSMNGREVLTRTATIERRPFSYNIFLPWVER